MYGTVAGAAAMVPSVGPITSTSTPKDSDVTGWLEEGSSIINTRLSSAGYQTPADAEAAIYPMLRGLAQLYAAATILQARSVDNLSGGEEDRSEQMYKRFRLALDALLKGEYGDLSGSGLIAIGGQVVTERSARIRTVMSNKVDGYSEAAP
jgi:hypothetical protein